MQQQYVPKPDNNMALAIFTTICCCLPLGIVAIIKATKVNEYYALQQYAAAQVAANDAKKYSLIGIIASVVINGLVYLLYGASIMALYGMGSAY